MTHGIGYNEGMSSELSALAQMAADLHSAEERVLILENELKKAKERRDHIQRNVIPDYMAEIGMEEFTAAGMKIKIDTVLSVKPKADARPRVLEEVEKLGAGALIKSTVSVAFNRNENDKARSFITDLQEKGLQPKQDRKIEPQTLKKFVKDRLEKGESVDMELFGVSRFARAQIAEGAPEPVFDGE